MSTEIVTEELDADVAPPPIVEVAKNGKPPKAKLETKPEEDQEGKGTLEKSEMSAVLKEVRLAEDLALKDVLEQLGPDGSFKIRIVRLEPNDWPDSTGKRVKVDGFLKSYTQKIDEEFIQKQHGGGRFEIRIFRKNSKGQLPFFAQRTIEIGGDPRLDDVPRSAPLTAAAAAAPQESSSLVTKTFDIMAKQLEDARKAANEPREDDDRSMSEETKMLLQMMRDQATARDAEIKELRRDMAEQRNARPPDDSFKEHMLKRFVEDDGSRAQSIRIAYEAEIRTLKDGQHQQEERIRDRAERDMQRLVESHNREIANMRSQSETLAAAGKMAVDTQIALLKEDNRKLERDNTELRAEVKELRAKKDKSLVEQAKEIREVRDALGEDEGEKSTMDRFAEALPALPEVMKAAKGMFGAAAPAAVAQNATAVVPVAPKRQVVRNQQGEKFMLNTATGQLSPVKAKKDVVQMEPGGPAVPQLEVAQVAMTVGLLENAFKAGTDPDIVAQSARPSVPEAILVALRDLGVDDFLAKVAKIPTGSPLSSVAGRNWARKVGAALLG